MIHAFTRRFPIAAISIVQAISLPAQSINNPSEANQTFNIIKILTTTQTSVNALNVPSYTFTLPKPNYRLPTNIQNMIMFAIKIDPSKEAVLRDEYKAVYKQKADLVKWLDENIHTTWSNVFRNFMNLAQYYSNVGDVQNLAITLSMGGENGDNLTSQADRWIAYVNSNW